MEDQTHRTETDPVLAGWNRFRRVLRAHALPINAAAVLVWIALLIVTIVDHWHAYLGIATVCFGLSVIDRNGVLRTVRDRQPGGSATQIDRFRVGVNASPA